MNSHEKINSPFNNFMRTTSGKKIYFEDPKYGLLPPNKINQLTEAILPR